MQPDRCEIFAKGVGLGYLPSVLRAARCDLKLCTVIVPVQRYAVRWSNCTNHVCHDGGQKSEWKCSEPARRVNVNSDSENFDLLRRRGQTAGRCSNGGMGLCYSCCETCRWARMINGMLHARGWRTLHVPFQPAEGSLRVSVRMTVTAGATSTGRNVSLAPGPTWLWELAVRGLRDFACGDFNPAHFGSHSAQMERREIPRFPSIRAHHHAAKRELQDRVRRATWRMRSADEVKMVTCGTPRPRGSRAGAHLRAAAAH